MADETVFSPAPLPLGPAPGSAELLFLRAALFVLQGKYFDPIKNADTALPPHRWVLHTKSGDGANRVFSESQTSDAEGLSTIFQTAEMATVGADEEWDLLLVPIFDGVANSDEYGTMLEVWLDVDTTQWVLPSEVHGSNAPTNDRLQTRRLLRFPVWSTRRKIAMGGGFVEDNPNSADFKTTGLLKTSELKPHGSSADPWVIQLDHEWFRSFVQLRYYDPIAKKEEPIPLGPILQAIAGDLDFTMGASSVRMDDGSVYLLQQQSSTSPEDFNYQLRLDGDQQRRVSFKYADKKLAVETTSTEDMEELGTHYVLPNEWRSSDQEAWEGAVDASAAVRKPFVDIRKLGTTASKPISFHLDDLALVDLDGALIPRLGARIALLDALLRFRDQTTDRPFSTLQVKQMPNRVRDTVFLRAEEAVFVRGKGLEEMTRIVEYEGRIFALERDRVLDVAATAPLRGARAARMPSLVGTGIFASVSNHSEMYLVDTRYLRHTLDGKNAKLGQLLVYVSCFVTTNPADDKPAGTNPAKAFIPVAEKELLLAAETWNQKHPAQPAKTKGKEYFLIPKTAFANDSTILRVRHLFGSRPQLNRMATKSGGATSANISLEIHPAPGRATGGDPMHLFLEFGPKPISMTYGQQTAAQKQNHSNPIPVPADFQLDTGRKDTDRVDSLDEFKNTLAHELGHSKGLPDEYKERLEFATAPRNRLTFLPQFDQARLSGRLFQLDSSSMMVSNFHPRLRYMWPLRQMLNANIRPGFSATHWLTTESPFVPNYRAGARNLIYDLGPTAQPWAPHKQSKQGLSELFLHHLGDDESSIGPMFLASGFLATPFDSIIVVRVKFWFAYQGIASDSDRVDVMRDFGLLFYDMPKLPRFFIQAPAGAALFKRTVILFLPLFEYDPQPSTLSFGPPVVLQQLTNADLRVRVRNTLATPTLTAGAPPTLDVAKTHVGPFLTRVALDQTKAAVFNGGPLTPADLQPINTWLATQLARAAGTILPY